MERKEAIEIIKKNYPDSSFTMLREALGTLIPELKESEDEKIRNVLVYYFKKYKEQEECGIKTFFGIPTDNIIAWLEKQREKKPAFDIDIPFGAKDSELIEASYYIPEGFHAEIEGNNVVIKKGEQKPAEEPVWYDNMDDLIADGMIDEIQKSNLSKGSKHNRIYWIKKHRVQPKQEWSKEDEKMFRTIISDGIRGAELDKAQIDWLKSLKDRVQSQSTWKPSDEQIKAVKEAACYSSVFSDKTIDNLISLSKDLKKLKG